MHPVLLSFAIYATAVLIGAAVLVVRHVRAGDGVGDGDGFTLPAGPERPQRRPVRLQPWMDLDGSARRQRRRLTPLH